MLDSVQVHKDPFGVVLVMGAWNYPLQLTLAPVAGAIAAGNCVIIKPSEVAPASAKFMAEVIPKYLDNVSLLNMKFKDRFLLGVQRSDANSYTNYTFYSFRIVIK